MRLLTRFEGFAVGQLCNFVRLLYPAENILRRFDPGLIKTPRQSAPINSQDLKEINSNLG